MLAERLAGQRDVKVGVCSRPQANLADFYREMGDLFGVELRPHNRWAGAKVLRERCQTHIDASLARPCSSLTRHRRCHVDDPDTFNVPWSAIRHYRGAQIEMHAQPEEVCAENNQHLFDYHIPIANKTDF